MKGKASNRISKRRSHEDGGCPLCGDTNFNVDTFCCEKCECTVVDCPFCGNVIFYENKYHVCDCVAGVYGYGPQGFSHEKKQFAAWRRRLLRPPNFNPDGMEDPSEDPHEVRQLAESVSWMRVMVVGDDGAFGHSCPDVYFLVRPEDQSKLEK